MSQQVFVVERGGVGYALPAEMVTGVQRFAGSLVRLHLAVGNSLDVEHVSMPIDAPLESMRRLTPGAERALPGALGVLSLPQGLVLAVQPAFFSSPPVARPSRRVDPPTEIRGVTGANGDAMLLHLAGTPARLLLPAAQVLEVVAHPQVIRLEPNFQGLMALMEWQASILPVYGFAAGPPERVALLRGTASAEVCAVVMEDRVERVRWPLRNVHAAVEGFAPPLPVRGAFGYQGQPLLIPDVDLLAA